MLLSFPLYTSLFVESAFELLLLNYAIHSRIRHHCEYFCTVAGPGPCVEIIQSGSESGARKFSSPEVSCRETNCNIITVSHVIASGPQSTMIFNSTVSAVISSFESS